MIRQRDVWWVDLSTNNNGKDEHIQSGIRPAVIISNDINNRYCPCVQIIPLTTKYDGLPQHRYIYVKGLKNYVLPDQVLTIPKSKLLRKYEVLSKGYFLQVIDALNIQLGRYGRRYYERYKTDNL